MSTSSWSPRKWSISTRVLSIASTPVLAMFIALAVTLYADGKRQVAETVQKSGQLIARAMADSSQYGVIAHNVESLQRATERTMQAQDGIAGIEVLDSTRHVLASSGRPSRGRYTFEQPITADALNVDLFDSDAPHFNGPQPTQRRPAPERVIGYVRVAMSDDPFLALQKRRVYASIGLMIAVCAASVLLGQYLAKNLIRSPFNAVIGALRNIRQGNLEVTFEEHHDGELGELQGAIETMAHELKTRRDKLEQLVDFRTQELRRVAEQAKASDAERRRLIAHTVDLVERERRRISRELHDQFNASLLSVKLRVAALAVDDGKPVDQSEVAATAEAVTREVEKLYADVRRLIRSLRPEVLDSIGLAGAITEAVRMFNAEHPGCQVDIEVPEEDHPMPRLSDEVSIAAFRFVQEALSNIGKHAQANHAHVLMRYDDQTGEMTLQVDDDGVGFDTASTSLGFGLLGMRERVTSVGGTLLIQSEGGKGTLVRASYPTAARSPNP